MELWDLYDRDGKWQRNGHPRGQSIPKGLYHLVVSVIIQHQDGDYLAMQRSYEKGTTGGYFEVSASGAVKVGESAASAVRRELQEETGLDATDWQRLCKVVLDEMQTIYCLYYAKTIMPKDHIQLQAHETIGYRWVDLEALKQMARADEVIGIGAWWLLEQAKQ
ncbi:MAG: NUDIX domain-containing protein [Aerococcus sp.]|nr:NUDIX domain-containing protein [Aerococcus sp.]